MKNRKWYEWLLALVFAAMVGLCLALNMTGGQKEGMANLLVNVGMFVIVAAIFLSCDLGKFRPTDDLTADLDRMTAKIKSDALNSHDYLWDQYSAQEDGPFTDPRLKTLYQDYVFELKRIAASGKPYCKTTIENYINGDLVDTVLHRNQLNQVAGALTGLGILGTFIGLSLGLQNFNTGSTAQITGSIAPLMDGIKVAFHTSIYGMIFSLVFNYVYKRRIYDAEESVKEFTAAWRKYVIPDTEDDAMNRLIEVNEQQLAAFNTMGERMSKEIAAQMDPNFEKLGKLISDFEAVATEEQKDALRRIVNEFTAEMNRSLNDAFTKTAKTVDDQYRMQQMSAEEMQKFYKQVSDVNEEMQKELTSLQMQTENNLLMKKEWVNDMQAVVDACVAAAQSVDSLKEEVERFSKSRRRI